MKAVLKSLNPKRLKVIYHLLHAHISSRSQEFETVSLLLLLQTGHLLLERGCRRRLFHLAELRGDLLETKDIDGAIRSLVKHPED